MATELWLIRHGETEWSLSGAHTGRTDLPLLDEGRKRAACVGEFLGHRRFALVLSSPLQRALETCRIAGYGDVAQLEPDLQEWDYGAYEGLKTSEIRRTRPDWNIWKDGVEGGETIEQVAERARRVIARALTVDGEVALFAHGHVLRILATCWLGLPPQDGRLFPLDTAALSVLGAERETRALQRWNLSCVGL